MMAQSEKEKSQEEEKQGHSKSEEQSCKEPCPQNEKREEHDEDMEGKQREKGQEKEQYTGERGGKKSEVTIDNLEDTVVNIEQVQKNENQGEKNNKPEENNIQADEATAVCEKEKSQVDEKAIEPRDQSSKVTINNVKEGENDEENVQSGGKGSQDRSDNKQAETTKADQQEPRKAKEHKKFGFLKKRKYITIKTGNTQDTHEEFLKLLHRQIDNLMHVDKDKEFKFIMVFCPVVSRAGTEIEAALCQLNKKSDTKPAVLVVLHCTNDPECVVPESRRAVSRDKTIAVDCLFSEDYGLRKCEKNKAAMCKVVQWLKTKPWRESR
ncbi:cilia- and flagella-associated protein 251-like [Hemibagrus wyckioides]|uniref:cilia- and flagella-associated protein 251-like n=1 Tax=Hemibagrus wyckioides TaxID=337641 RepID=UPI00266C5AAE|nr:cilia- and flagella-associated protein 251-like [Hemibagrus wyckioides]